MAFLGRSNVGKSSLINAVLGRKSLAHTSKTPGKTRSANVYQVGSLYHLVDLPGYGFARGPRSDRAAIHGLIKDYLSKRGSLTGAVWLLDVRRDPSPDDIAMGDLLLQRSVPVLVAITKTDKIARSSRRERIRAILDAVGIPEDQCVGTSVSEREGIAELRHAIAALAKDHR